MNESSVVVPVSETVLADMPRLRWSLEASMDSHPLTREEQQSGWREFTSSDGITGHFPVGWRRERQIAELETEREAEKAACPYVACTCGWHEE